MNERKIGHALKPSHFGVGAIIRITSKQQKSIKCFHVTCRNDKWINYDPSRKIQMLQHTFEVN